MRSFTALSASMILLVAVGTARATADTRILSEERTQIDMGETKSDTTTEATVWVGNDRAARLTPSGRIISRVDRGEAYMVDDAHKSYTLIKREPAPSVGATAKLRKAGESRQIGSWHAERYDLDFEVGGEAGHAILWMSTDVNFDMDVYRAFTTSLADAMGMAWLKAVAAVEGYPVLQEVTMGPVRVTTRLVSISEETPPAGLYEPPAGYERK